MTIQSLNTSITNWINWANKPDCQRYDIALLKIFIQFDNFIADLFIEYCTGKSSEKGYTPELKLQFQNEEHLNAFLRENRTYIDYSTKIRQLSKHIFVDSPFEKAIYADANNSVMYGNIISIRNYVAHESGEARTKYIKSCYGGDESKFKEPNDYLQDKRKGSGQTHFSEYIAAIQSMASILINPPS